MKRVFLIEPTRYGLSNLETFGKVVYLFDESNPRPGFMSPGFSDAVLQRLEALEYDPDDDYFAAVAPVAALVQAIAAVAGAYEKFQALLFDAAPQRYVARQLGNVEAASMVHG